MEQFKFHPNLEGKNILIIENTRSLMYKEYERLLKEHERMVFVGTDVMPSSWGQTLFEYMQENGLDLAIIHDFVSDEDVEQIIEARTKGKKIAVLKKGQNNPYQQKRYDLLEQNGVTCLSKLEPSYIRAFEKALDMLSNEIK